MKFYSNASICWFLKNRKLKSQITTASKNAGRSKTNHNSSTTPWIPLHFLASITKRSKLHVETFESILVFCWLVTSLQLEVRLKETWDPHSKGTTFQNLSLPKPNLQAVAIFRLYYSRLKLYADDVFDKCEHSLSL